MRSLVAILSIVFIVHFASAQDTTAHKKDGAISLIKQPLQSVERNVPDVKQNLNVAIDTLKTPKLDSLAAIRKLDSLKTQIAEKKSAVATVTDSIQRIINLPNDKINKVNSKIQSQTDSLLQKVNKPIDNVNDEIIEKQQAVQDKINGVEVKVQDKADNVQDKLEQGVEKATDGEVKLPDDGIKIPGQDTTLPTQDIGLNGIGLPETDLPGLDAGVTKLEVPTVETPKLPDAKLDVKSLGEKTDVNMDVIQNISGEINKVDGKLAEAGKYEDEIKNIKENGIQNAEMLPEEMEKRAADAAGLEKLNTEKAKLTEYQSVIQRYKDEKLLQEEIKRKAKAVVNDKLNQYSPAFKEAQEHIAKAKKIRPGVQAFKDIAKKRPNTMKGKPFRQRFIPGVTLQGYNNDKFAVDLAAQAGYRLTGRLSTGIGYTYRISISEDNTNLVSGEGVSGYRFYTDFRLIKSFFFHGDFETISLDRNKQPALFETKPGQVYGSYFGIGKRYNVSRKVHGTVMGLYHVNYKGEVPGLSKITLRIGFDYNLKKMRRRYLSGKL